MENLCINTTQFRNKNVLIEEFLVFLIITLILNPIFLIIFFGFYNLFRKIDFKILFLWAISYSTLLANRKYFIRFSESANDDTITYIPHILNLKNLSFLEAFKLENMTGVEPFSQFYWWVSQTLSIPISIVILSQLCLWTIGLVILASSISKRYAAILLLFAIGLFPALIPYAFFHQYRQSWAMFFVCISLSYYSKSLINRFKILYLISHLSTMLIWLFDLLINFINRKGGLKIIYILIISIIMYLLFVNSIVFRINKYFIESEGQVGRSGMTVKSIIGIISITLFYKYTDYSIKKKIIYYTTLVVFVISFFPFLESFSNRLISLVIPISLIVIAPIRSFRLLTILVIISSTQLFIYLFTNENLYSYTIGSLSPKIILPFYDFLHFILFGDGLFKI